MRPFIFASANLPALKAKQLKKAFPFIKLSAAQEATARSLGYSSWYECTQRGNVGKPSPSDQEAGINVRVVRYCHQAGVLMNLGLTPIDADLWVRAWGLTGKPTLAPEAAVPDFYRWREAVELIESGQLSEKEIEQEWIESQYSKHPDIDRPVRICPGVILSPCGKYPHYAVDPALQAHIPIYLRGPQSLFHYEDNGDVLAMTVPGFPQDQISITNSIYPLLNRVQHEWHFGTPHPESNEPLLLMLEAAALAVAEKLIVISDRATPGVNDTHHFDRRALACLRGIDFAAFIRGKGVLDTAKVIWYRDVTTHISLEFSDWLRGNGGIETLELPIFAETERYRPCLPIYSYPFMNAPMHIDEYSGSHEQICLLPLDQDYQSPDSDRDDGDDDDRPDAPRGPELSRAWADLVPA